MEGNSGRQCRHSPRRCVRWAEQKLGRTTAIASQRLWSRPSHARSSCSKAHLAKAAAAPFLIPCMIYQIASGEIGLPKKRSADSPAHAARSTLTSTCAAHARPPRPFGDWHSPSFFLYAIEVIYNRKNSGPDHGFAIVDRVNKEWNYGIDAWSGWWRKPVAPNGHITSTVRPDL